HPRSVCGPSWLAQAKTTASYFSLTISGLASHDTTSTSGDNSWCRANTKAKLPVLPPQSLKRCSAFSENASVTESDGAINATRMVTYLVCTRINFDMVFPVMRPTADTHRRTGCRSSAGEY